MPNVGPGVTYITNPNGWVSVTTPSTNPVSVGFYQTLDGENTLATVAASGTAFFNVTQGGFFVQGIGGEASYTLTQVTTGTKLYELITGGTIVTNATAETVTAQTSIPANFLQAGTTIRIKWAAQATGVNSTNTVQPILRFGPAGTSADTALITGSAVNPSANQQASGEFVLVCRAAPGGTVALVGTGTYVNFGAVATASDGAYMVPTNFATNALLYVTLTLTQSAASTSNTALAEIFEVIIN